MVNKLKELRSTGAEEGFTLIELMIVVVIIGILAAIAIPIFANQQKSAIVAGVKSDVKNTNTNIATALVKAPTSTTVTGYGDGANATGTVLVSTGVTTPFDVIVSDSGTVVAVSGAWNTYKVLGWNSASFSGTKPANAAAAASATATTPGVQYSVASGKTATVGD